MTAERKKKEEEEEERGKGVEGEEEENKTSKMFPIIEVGEDSSCARIDLRNRPVYSQGLLFLASSGLSRSGRRKVSEEEETVEKVSSFE